MIHVLLQSGVLQLFFRISSSHIIINSICWSHALANGPTSKRPASDGGRCSGQLLMMWSAVCSCSPHAELSARPHFFVDDLYRPTPVRSLFRVVPCFRLRSSPLTPSPGSDKWRCTRVGPDAPHSCFHVAVIHASFDRSSRMTHSKHLLSLLVVGFTGLESAWRHFILCRVVQDMPFAFHCFPCPGKGGCFPPYAGSGYPC